MAEEGGGGEDGERGVGKAMVCVCVGRLGSLKDTPTAASLGVVGGVWGEGVEGGEGRDGGRGSGRVEGVRVCWTSREF